MDNHEFNIVFVHPFFPESDVRYVMGIDTQGVLRERVGASIWKLNTDGTLERVRYSEDIPSGDPSEDH